MSSAFKRLSSLAAHFSPSSSSPTVPSAPAEQDSYNHRHNIHQLSPTVFLPRAAAIEPEACAIYHVTANKQILRRSYQEAADRARGLAYFLLKYGYKRVGILAPNTPAFLESIYGIGAAGAVNVAINYRLKEEDIEYIFDHAEVDSIIVDAEFEHLLGSFKTTHPTVAVVVDTDTEATEGGECGPFDRAVNEGLEFDRQTGGHGWDSLETECVNEEGMLALSYTSGTTARPKGVVYTHRGAYLATLGNIVESSLNVHNSKADRCHYLWSLPMFHASGWTFPWAVTAVRGTHYCLRKIDYPEIWRLLKDEAISHFNAAPTVNILLCADPNAEKLSEPVRVTVAASPPTAHLFETMENLNLNPVHVYGLTETYGPITKGYFKPHWNDLEVKEKYGRMARQGHGSVASLPVRVVKTKEDDPDEPSGDLIEVKRDGKEIGEIIFTGNLCAKEYYKNPEATRKLFLGGALHSGDLAVWHPDGAIQILDRAKDIIISGGENISSLALESLLVTHPDILEAACVATPDEQWGERPKAFITVQAGKKGQLTGDQIIDWAKNKSGISRFMVPREVEVLDELPKTSTGKLRKNVLRDWAKGGKRDV